MKTYMSHIDTLYLYRKVFTEYDHLKLANHIYDIDGLKDLGFSGGYEWYDLGYCRIGIMEYDRALLSNNYSLIVQYQAIYLMQREIKNIEFPFGDDLTMYFIKRIDYSFTFNTASYNDFNLLEFIPVSPNFRKSSYIYGSNRKVETVYLGLRKTGKVFRMYNKSKELTDRKNHLKRQILHSFFGDTQNLIVFEIELHRKYLRERCNISNMSELNKIDLLVASLFTNLKFCENNNFNRNNIQSKHYDRIDFIYPFQKILKKTEFKLNVVKKYKKSERLLVDSIFKLLDNYNSDEQNILDIDTLCIALSSKNIEIEYDEEYIN